MIGKLFGFKRKRTPQVSNQGGTSVDKDYNYCPRCGDEYRVDIVKCASCQVDLISGAEKLKLVQQASSQKSGRSMKISETDELVTVIGGKLNDVKSTKNLLAKESIPSLIVGEGHAKGWGGPDFQLKVNKSDYKTAGALLQKDYIEKTGLANSEVEIVEAVFNPFADHVTCPACSTQFKPTSAICPECGLQFG